MTDRERYKAALHLIVDALPDDASMKITFTGKHSCSELSIYSDDKISWAFCDLRWASMTSWGGDENADPPDALASRFYERAATSDPRITKLLIASGQLKP